MFKNVRYYTALVLQLPSGFIYFIKFKNMVKKLTNGFVRAIFLFKHNNKMNKSLNVKSFQTGNITNNAVRCNRLGLVLQFKVVNIPQPKTYVILIFV